MALKIKLGIEKRALVLFYIVNFRYILQSNVFGLFLAKFLLFLSKAFLMTDDFALDILPTRDLIHTLTLFSLPDFIFCVKQSKQSSGSINFVFFF